MAAGLLWVLAFGTAAAETVSFGTDWKAQAEHGGFYQAIATGIYRKHGLDVKLRPGGPQVDVSTYVAGHGDASIISTTSDVNRFLSALLGGRLLKPAQLAEMQKTEPAAPYEIVYDEPGYGLGLMKRRTSCGEVWFHGGGYLNAITDNAVTSDGRRAVTVAIASSVEPGPFPIEQYKASAALIDHAICGTR